MDEKTDSGRDDETRCEKDTFDTGQKSEQDTIPGRVLQRVTQRRMQHCKRTMCRPVVAQNGSALRHDGQSSSVSGMGSAQCVHGEHVSSSSSFDGRRTNFSIFCLNASGIWSRYSGRISTHAYS